MPFPCVPALRTCRQDLAAGDGRDRREGPEDKAVVGQDERRGLQADDSRRGVAGGDLAALERRHTGEVVRRAVVQPDLVPGP